VGLVFRVDANLTYTSFAINAEKPHYFSLVVLLRAIGLPLQQRFVILELKLFYWRHLMSFERRIPKQFVCVYTITAQEFCTFKAVADLGALSLANPATDLASIAALSNSENAQQTVVMKTGRQFVKTVCFGDSNFGLTFRAAKLSIFLACQCVFLQTLAAECVKTRYCLGFGESIQTD